MPEINKPSPQVISRAKAWDSAFDATMLEDDVERLLRVEPFRSMDQAAFPASKQLKDILLNESRLRPCAAGEIIVRQGDYGATAFLILAGSMQVVFDLPSSRLGRSQSHRKSLLQALRQLWANPNMTEVRDVSKYGKRQDQGYQQARQGKVYIDDVASLRQKYKSEFLNSGQLFGEVSVLSRTPHTASIIAAEDSEVLEIKWQGLRDIMRYSKDFRARIENLYRDRSLKSQLQQMPLFVGLDDIALNTIVDQTLFESYGQFDWHVAFKQAQDGGGGDPDVLEPLVAQEGDYADGVIIIRSGFARVTQSYGDGQRTVDYLGAGDVYGLDIVGRESAYQYTLRAIGYADILRVPAAVIEKYVLGNPSKAVKKLLARLEKGKQRPERLNDLFEFLVDHRYINGTKTMLINLDRCTGCDDCVVACSNAHENNPRFIRHGRSFDRFMVANACMHCHDPVCLIGCPTGAIHRNPGQGQVIINDQTCIGCATCANSCPYHNIRMVNVRDDNGDLLLDESFTPIVKATKCDLCYEQKVTPSCQKACPHDALRRVDLRDLDRLKDWWQ